MNKNALHIQENGRHLQQVSTNIWIPINSIPTKNKDVVVKNKNSGVCWILIIENLFSKKELKINK